MLLSRNHSMPTERRFIMSVLTLTMTVLVAMVVIMPTQLDAYYTQNTGCHHNGSWYADKSLVPTTEKCLNCQCNKKTLVCRLKVCPEMPMPPPRGCVVVQKKNTCCPYLSCARLDAFYKIPSTRRIIAYLDHYERESIDRVVNENMLQRRSDDTEVDLYVCVKNGTVYKSGSAMSSSNLCSYCYCIGGTEKCVKPKCMLPVEGCKPIFVDSTCCPVRYDCSTKQTGKSSQEVRYRKTSNKHYMRMSQRLQRNRGCTVGQQFYAEGQKMKSDKDKPCDICFCIRGQRKCAPKKCSPALRNCIPVVPKGQCCPSSYDCGSQRDYRRSQNSRQFNLYSLLFGKDEDQETAAGTQIAVHYPLDRHPEVVEPNSKPQPVQNAEQELDKSIFDTIREGLEFIDSNNNQMIKDNLDLMGVQPSPTPIPLGLVQQPTSTTEVSFLDLLLGSSETNREETLSEESAPEEKNTTSGLSWVDLLLAPDEDPESSSVVSDKLDRTDSPGINDLTDFDSSTSIDRVDSSNITDSEENVGVLKAEDLDKIFITTTEEIGGETEPITDEETTQTLPTTLTETTEEIKSTESLQTDIISTTKKSTEFTSTSSTMTDESENSTTTKTRIASSTTSPEVKQKIGSIPLKDTKATIVNTTKPEKGSDFLSVLLDGLSDMLRPDNRTKTATNTTLNRATAKPSVMNITSSTLPTPKPMPHFKPLPVDKTYTRINSKIANLTVKPSVIPTKGLLNTTFKPLPPITSTNPIIPISEGLYQSTTSKTITTTPISPTFTANSSSTTTKSSITSTLKPVVIKTNPTILEAEPLDQNTEPTLPPSLPNLKIIPFLPTDAVKADHSKPPSYDFYHHSSDHTSRVDYDLYDDANLYPSITEKYPIYPDLEDGSKAEYIYKFNVEGPEALISSTAGKFDVTLGSPAFVKYDYAANGLQVPKGFSPPTKTEGGFVPKDPLILDDDNDNVSVKVGDSYQVTQHIIDITTAANILNTTKVIEITTPDPFKDVIHTEPPPDLTSLIEDKLKNLITQSTKAPSEIVHHHDAQEQSSEMHIQSESLPKIPMTDIEKEQRGDEISFTATDTFDLSDNKQKLKTDEEALQENSPHYVMSNTTLGTQELHETIEPHEMQEQQKQHVSGIPPFKSLPQAVIKQLDKEDSVPTTTMSISTTTMMPKTATKTIKTTTAKPSIAISIEDKQTTFKSTADTTTSKRPTIKHNNRNKTIANTTQRTTANKYRPQQQQQQQQPLALTKNKQTGHVNTATANGTKILSSSSYSTSSKTKGNATRRVTSPKPTKHNYRPTNRPISLAATSTHTANNPTTATKGILRVNATNVDTSSAVVAFKRTGTVASGNKPKTVSPNKKPTTTKVPATTTTTTATTMATTTKTTMLRTTTTSPPSTSASWPTTSTTPSVISTTTNPFLMSPFDKLPFMDASFEVKRISATPSFSASIHGGQTASAAFPSPAVAYTPSLSSLPSLSSSSSSAQSSANHPKLMGLVHYKHTLNQFEGLEHSSQGSGQHSIAYPTKTESIEVSTSSSASTPGGGHSVNRPQAQQQQQLSSSLNNLIDPTGILKLAGCNIYGRMYRVGRIILELSSPCLECKCTEIGVKCGPLEC